jgi:predicted nucleotidyltransferase
MSQTDLARRAKVSQPVISAYESGHREPGVDMLRKLIEASGHDLTISVTPRPDAPRGLPDTPVGRRLRRHRRKLNVIAAQRGATNLRVFGSVARGEDTEASDIDLLVDLAPGIGLFGLIGLQRELAELLGKDVDLVPASGLKADMRDLVVAEAISL